MQTKFELKDCPLTFISDDLITAGLNPRYDSPLYDEFPFKIVQAVICSQRRGYIGTILDDTHGALAKLFAAVDAGEVTDPEQLAVVEWLRADDGDVIESYRADDKCKVRDVYRAAIKLAQLALASQVNSDGDKYYVHVYKTQCCIERLNKDESVESILDTVCSIAKLMCTWDLKYNVPVIWTDECIKSMFMSMPYYLMLDKKYKLAIDDLGFTNLKEIESELRPYFKDRL